MCKSSRFLVGVAAALSPVFAIAAPFAYIPNTISDDVSIIDTATNTVTATVSVGSGLAVSPTGDPTPTTVAVDALGTRVYIGNFGGSISILDTARNAIIATVPVRGVPQGVALNPAGTRLYVAMPGSQSGSVSVIDTATLAVLVTIVADTDPWGIVVSPDGTRVYVANRMSSSISVIDASNNTVINNIAVPRLPQYVAIHPSGTRAYVTHWASNMVSVIDTVTNSVIANIGGNGPWGAAVNSAGTRVYVANSASNNVSVIDTATNAVVATVPVGTDPRGIAVTPSGARVYVANRSTSNVSVIDTASNTVVATVKVGIWPEALGQFIVPAVGAPPTTNPDLNQHGLTGSWFEQATSGQGVEVEVFPNSSGTGSTFVSWFTFDTVVGGAEHQRWYTAQGQVVSGQPNASLTIYQNTGGNFEAPPVTTRQPVGTAMLSFDTCSSGQLLYSFTDGTGRSGTIPLTRLTQNVTCSTTTPYPTNADFALSGNWYTAATSGQGFTVEVNPNSGAFFSAWYTYMPNGAAAGVAGQRWYTAQGTFATGIRSIPVTIYETAGGSFDTPTPPGQQTVAVGTGTMAFHSCMAATFSYNFTGGSSNGLSGSISLSRVGPVPPGCTS